MFGPDRRNAVGDLALSGNGPADPRAASPSRANNGGIRHLLRSPRVAKWARYAVGSLSASVVSAIVLTSLSWHHTVPPAAATVVTFVAGALVNFTVFRFWAWRHTLIREVGAVGRDFVKFSAVAIVTALIAAGTTTLAGRYADHSGLSSAQRTLLIDGSYFGTFAVMFLIKFVILDRFVFNEHRRADTSTRPGRTHHARVVRAASRRATAGLGSRGPRSKNLYAPCMEARGRTAEGSLTCEPHSPSADTSVGTG